MHFILYFQHFYSTFMLENMILLFLVQIYVVCLPYLYLIFIFYFVFTLLNLIHVLKPDAVYCCPLVSST